MTSKYLERPVMSLAERRAEIKEQITEADLGCVFAQSSWEYSHYELRAAALRAQLDNLTEE